MIAKRRTLLLVPVLATALVVLGLAGCGDAPGERQREVAERGVLVMPFDLDATTHTFTPTDSGGVQDVVADNPDDAEQVRLIREHLREERERFARGDFGDPARIHGEDMPGLAALRAGHARIDVAYEELPDGARLTYRTEDPALVRAIAAWFAAQVADHGEHAGHG